MLVGGKEWVKHVNVLVWDVIQTKPIQSFTTREVNVVKQQQINFVKELNNKKERNEKKIEQQ